MSKLDSNKVWLDANKLAEKIYDILDDFSYEEKLNTARKLQNSINDFIFYVGQAVGAEVRQHTAEFDWAYANKALLGARTMYRFAGKQGMIELNPSVMVLMDDLENSISEELKKTARAIQKANKDDLKPWLEKHKLWQEMQVDKT
jgi:hypothetical protein